MALTDQAEEGVLRGFGDVERVEEGRVVKKINRSDVRGIKPRGRPRMGLMNRGARRMSVGQGRVVVCTGNEWTANANP